MDDLVDMCSCHCTVRKIAESSDAHFQQSLKPCADHIKREPENKSHDAYKNRDRRIFSCEISVNILAACALPALFRLGYSRLADLLNKRIAHICDCCAAVQSALIFHLLHDVFHRFSLILIQLQLRENESVSLDNFASRESNRQAGIFSMVLDQMADCMNTSVHCSAMIVLITEILAKGPLLIMSNMNSMVDQLIHALIFCG